MAKERVSKKKAVKRTTAKKATKPKAEKNFDQDFEYVCLEIEKGKALRRVCPTFMSVDKFLQMCSENKILNERYARACEARAGAIFDEIIEISDGGQLDDPIKIQRDRLKIDARKWTASKLAPKKYGDKLDLTTDGEKLQSQVTIFQLPDNGR